MTDTTYTDTPSSEISPTFGQRVAGIIVSPRQTFARMTDADAWYWATVLLVVGYTVYFLANGVGGARWQVGWMSQLVNARAGSTDPAAQSVQAMFAWIASASQLFTNLLAVPISVAGSLAVRCALFYGLAQVVGGSKPPWGRVVAMVGWAWLPLLLQYCLVGALMLASPKIMLFFLPLPDQTGAATTTAPADFSSKWPGQMLFYLSPFVFWNLALCIIGVQELFQLSRARAALVVLLPAIIQVVYLLFTYLVTAAFLQGFTGSMPGSPTAPGGP